MYKELIKTKIIFPPLCAAVFMLLLLCFPSYASAGVKSSIIMCCELIVPSLFPFFIACSLLNETELSAAVGRKLAPLAAKLFGVSGIGATAFITGVTGGYPLGASYIADLRRKNLIESKEASHLLIFCNNSGPAFIIGAAGCGIFGSVRAGFFLYGIHIISALLYGIIFSPETPYKRGSGHCEKAVVSLSAAVTNSVKSAVAATVSVCGFITAFSVVGGILTGTGILFQASGALSHTTGAELGWCRAFLFGILELGNGIGNMSGFVISPENLALTAFLLGFGGISVHFQTFAMISGTDIKAARYIIGRLFIALLGSASALLGSYFLF